ncbi:MAG: divalent-cation tolerance protein CutA [Deltaproteobacteria bacterium]|nr:divalent-cation tolerance protein CutA [Deltaproteobacteria bacterium]
MSEKKYIVVFVTAASEEEAAKLGHAVVEDGLSACCNIVPSIRSIYKWEGKVFDENEVLCIMKTRKELFGALKKRVIELHSYDVPEVISLKIKDGSEDYLRWISEVTKEK